MQNNFPQSLDGLTRRTFVQTSGALFTAATAGIAPADEGKQKKRISYFRNGEIYVTPVGEPEGKPLTTGHMPAKILGRDRVYVRPDVDDFSRLTRDVAHWTGERL